MSSDPNQTVKSTLKQAKDIHSSITMTLPQQLENYMTYLRTKASEKPSMVPCGGCGGSKSTLRQSFRRAFNNFSYPEKADFYLKNVTILDNTIKNNLLQPKLKEQKKTQLNFFNQNDKQWQLRKVEIYPQKKIMRLRSSGEELDMHNYILRKSKKKQRQTLALESVQTFQLPQTIRISNNKQSFNQLKSLLQGLIDESIQQNFLRQLNRQRINIERGEKQFRISQKNITNDKNQRPFLKDKQNKQIPMIDLEVEKPVLNRTDSILRESGKGQNIKNIFGNQGGSFQQGNNQSKIKERQYLFQSLNNIKDFQQIRRNVFYDSRKNRFRKVYQVNSPDEKIPLKWFQDNFTNPPSFYRWKKSLQNARLLKNDHYSEIRLFSQTHTYKNRQTISYIYNRQKIIKNGTLYFVDTGPSKPLKDGEGNIDYCITRFQQQERKMIIIIESVMTHSLTPASQIQSRQWTDEFLGELVLMCNNPTQNLSFMNDTDVNINTAIFELEYLSQIEDYQDVDQIQFYSIQGSEDNDDIRTRQSPSFGKSVSKSISNILDHVKRVLTQEQTLNLPEAKNRLKFHHPNIPFPKGKPKYLTPKTPGQHSYFQGQWKISEKGEMININEEKVKAQRGVLKSLVKTIGKNLITGKSILNISLPVTVFSKESNLSLLCKSYSWAPYLLEKAIKQADPVNRLKYIIAFGISCTIAYIQMEKPFNPILGQTFQTLIDGCPVYGEQTSHHPPISSTFMKGRGYTIFGNFEAKVSISINSATGSNDGLVHVCFNQNNLQRDIVKFTIPPGEITGLTYGDRKLAPVEKSFYLDVQNMLFAEISFGKHKGKTQYCKFVDGIEGTIVKLKKDADVKKLQKINKKYIETSYGLINGRWTGQVFYDQELIFNSWKELPFMAEGYPCPLESDAYYRKDLQLRIKNDLQAAQEVKEEMENIQRNDRKLREKLGGSKH